MLSSILHSWDTPAHYSIKLNHINYILNETLCWMTQAGHIGRNHGKNQSGYIIHPVKYHYDRSWLIVERWRGITGRNGINPLRSGGTYMLLWTESSVVQVMACRHFDAVSLPGPWFNIKMSSYQYRNSHFGDKTAVRSSYLHNGISYTGKMSSLYWIGPLLLTYSQLDPGHLFTKNAVLQVYECPL